MVLKGESFDHCKGKVTYSWPIRSTIHTWYIEEDSAEMHDSDAGSSLGSASTAANIESSHISSEGIGTWFAGTVGQRILHGMKLGADK